MAIYDTDKTSDNRSKPTPNTNDKVISPMARKTISTSYSSSTNSFINRLAMDNNAVLIYNYDDTLIGYYGATKDRYIWLKKGSEWIGIEKLPNAGLWIVKPGVPLFDAIGMNGAEASSLYSSDDFIFNSDIPVKKYFESVYDVSVPYTASSGSSLYTGSTLDRTLNDADTERARITGNYTKTSGGDRLSYPLPYYEYNSSGVMILSIVGYILAQGAYPDISYVPKIAVTIPNIAGSPYYASNLTFTIDYSITI